MKGVDLVAAIYVHLLHLIGCKILEICKMGGSKFIKL